MAFLVIGLSILTVPFFSYSNTANRYRTTNENLDILFLVIVVGYILKIYMIMILVDVENTIQNDLK